MLPSGSATRLAIGLSLVTVWAKISFVEHDELPVRISGILKVTGTPVDKTVHVGLAAIEAIHADWHGSAGHRSGGNAAAGRASVEKNLQGQGGHQYGGEGQDGGIGGEAGARALKEARVRAADLTPKAVTAALIGVKSKLAIFKLQRAINSYAQEPLTAVVPGLALLELWQLVGTAEVALSAVSLMVLMTALLGMAIMILTTLNERRREMAILRSVGAGGLTIVGLLLAEAGMLTVFGIILGITMVYAGLALVQPIIDQSYGLYIPVEGLAAGDFSTAGMIFGAGLIMGLLPALWAYRMSVADGMMVRV